MSILNQYVNYFQKSSAVIGSEEYYGDKILLRSILIQMHTFPKHLDTINALRAYPKDSAEQKKFKNTKVPCFTISGYFEKDGKGSRTAIDLIYHTCLIGLDLDPKNPHADLKALKQQVKREPFVAYVGDSCRGEGIFVIVHVADPEKHKWYFDFFKRWLEQNGCKGTFDEQTKNVNRLRYVAPDSNHCLNDNTIPLPFTEVKQPQRPSLVFKHQPARNYSGNTLQGKIDFAAKILDKQGMYFEDKNKHNYIFNLCCLLNKMGITQDEAEAYISTLIPLNEIKSNCLDYPYKTYSNEFNVWDFKNENASGNSFVIQKFPAPKKEIVQSFSVPQVVVDNIATPKVITPPLFVQTKPEIKSTEWDEQIAELQSFFSTASLPVEAVKLNDHSTITNLPLFIQSHLTIIKANNGKRTFEPYLTRLKQLRDYLGSSPIKQTA